MHIASAVAHLLFNFFRLVLRRSSTSRNSYILYAILSVPALIVEFWFQNIGAPSYGSDGELRRAGEDLEAKGLTEFLMDIFWWTLGVTVVAGVFGNKIWWFWSLAPIYGAYLAFTTYKSMSQGMAGMSGQSEGADAATSNRQKKLEKRGGQRMQHRA